MIYSADSAAGGVHLIKANNEEILRLYSTGIIAYKPFNANGGILSNSPSNSFYVGGGNAFDGTAITNPKVVNGIATGTGDGYTNQYFNNAINSWYGTGFVDTWSKACRATIDHRTGNFITQGFFSAGNSIYTPVIKGINGLEYDTTTGTGIHNFKINGVQKVYINNTDLTNTVNLTQIGASTFTGVINANGGILTNNGSISTNNNIYTPKITGSYGLEYTVATGTTHNFKIDGLQKVSISTNDLTNYVNLTQTGEATFSNNITVNGQSTFNNTINANAGISLGGTNTDPVSITKNYIGNNFSELALCPGDDPSGNTITLPLSGDTAQDYVTVRTYGGVHHAFSTSGNYYCAGNIVVNGTVTATSFSTSSTIGAILNGTLNNVSSITSGTIYRLGYINVTTGTWMITSQLSVYVQGANGNYIHGTNCLSLYDASLNSDFMVSLGSQVPYGHQSQTTMYYKALSNTTIYFNFAISTAGGTISILLSGCFLKAIRTS
jgi:hypothetical protein